MSIGALSRATGIPVETLRTWERRYGFPVPERKPSGHRVYPVASVARLRRIAEALGGGHRAAEVVGAPESELAALLSATAASPAGAPLPVPALLDRADLLRAVEAFNADRLARILLADWALLAPLDFLEQRVTPLLRAVGDAWAKGKLGIRHEHFLSERLGDLLRTLRLRLEERATGSLLVHALLPGEPHGLGLQMAALLATSAGCRCLYLGAESPVQEIAALVKDLGAAAAAISISVVSRGAASAAALRRLRALLPPGAALLVGGEGAPPARPGITVIRDLAALDAWARHLAATGSPPPAVGGRALPPAGA
jgi:DNA-binding transcriptional MerR regulator